MHHIYILKSNCSKENFLKIGIVKFDVKSYRADLKCDNYVVMMTFRTDLKKSKSRSGRA